MQTQISEKMHRRTAAFRDIASGVTSERPGTAISAGNVTRVRSSVSLSVFSQIRESDALGFYIQWEVKNISIVVGAIRGLYFHGWVHVGVPLSS